jgi:hypothetical protein
MSSKESIIKIFNFPDELVYPLETFFGESIKDYEIYVKDKIISGIILKGSNQGAAFMPQEKRATFMSQEKRAGEYNLAQIVKILSYIPLLKSVTKCGIFKINSKNQHIKVSVSPFEDEPVDEVLNMNLYNSLKNVLTEYHVGFIEKSPGILCCGPYLITCLYTCCSKGIYCNEIAKYDNDVSIGYFREYNQEHLALIHCCNVCKKGEIYDWMNRHFKHSCF